MPEGMSEKMPGRMADRRADRIDAKKNARVVQIQWQKENVRVYARKSVR